MLFVFLSSHYPAYAQNTEYVIQKTECIKNWKNCFIECLDGYGIDYNNPSIFSPLESTYKRICQSKCIYKYDCNAIYERLKDKGLIK